MATQFNHVGRPPSLTADQSAELEALVRSAFEQARVAGKPDWDVMTIAVLKNRILQATSFAFREADYGATRFVDLVTALPNLLLLDPSQVPPTVRWLPAEHERRGAIGTPPGSSGRLRVREDLWLAIFDYSAGGAYAWNGARAEWVSDPAEGDLILPTLTADRLGSIRMEFAKHHSDDARVTSWAESGLPTAALPLELRQEWNRALTELAEKLLRSWFGEHDIAPPVDLMRPPTAAPRPGRAEATEEELRRYVQRCVSVMTHAELRSLLLPVGVAARVRR